MKYLFHFAIKINYLDFTQCNFEMMLLYLMNLVKRREIYLIQLIYKMDVIIKALEKIIQQKEFQFQILLIYLSF